MCSSLVRNTEGKFVCSNPNTAGKGLALQGTDKAGGGQLREGRERLGKAMVQSK
jgi:hypothetical protein